MTDHSIAPWQEAKAVEMLPGVIRRTLGTTAGMMLVEFRSEAEVEVPIHSHPHQQVGYVVSGEMDIIIDGVKTRCKAGDSYAIPGDVPHGAFFPVVTVVVDCFSPPREDYQD